MTRLTQCVLAMALVGWPVGGMPAFAGIAPKVDDQAKFFSAEAVEKANLKIREIYREFNKDVLVETLPRIPANIEARYQENKKAFFPEWAAKRAEEAGVKGIYLLLTKEPAHLQIEVDRATRQRGFPPDARNRLTEKMLQLFKQKKNDDALLEAVNTIESSLRANLGRQSSKAGPAAAPVAQTPHPPQPGAGRAMPAAHQQGGGLPLWAWVLIGIGILVALWMLFGLLRGAGGAGAGGGGYGGPGGGGGGFGGGGGGFLTSMMAGMFGAAAGSWLYDRFLRGGESGGSQAYGAGPAGAAPMPGNEAGAGDFSGDAGAGGDFGDAGDTGGGGDFGDAGGGDFGDAGGGDFGGGDFGGGDTGGDF